nr:hypothetical protein [Alphaproteobacteria bacterium]
MTDKFDSTKSSGRGAPVLALTRPSSRESQAPAPVYLLADHLDTVLAACEDIANARLVWNRARRADADEVALEKHGVRDDIEDIRKLENTIIMRVLKSRERAEDVARADKRFRSLAKLYVAGTAVLVDAVEECGDTTEADFATADNIPSYLRSRGLIAADTPAPPVGDAFDAGEDFLIAKRIAVGPLMDLAATLLDALELHYDLFLDEDEMALPPLINRHDMYVPESYPVAVSQDEEQILHEAAGDDLGDAISEVRILAETAPDTSAEPAPEVWAKLSTTTLPIVPHEPPPEETDATDEASPVELTSSSEEEVSSEAEPTEDASVGAATVETDTTPIEEDAPPPVASKTN